MQLIYLMIMKEMVLVWVECQVEWEEWEEWEE
jgi:hypothetical protein